jgi:hypothetical protein
MATGLAMPLSVCCCPLVRMVHMFRAIMNAFARRKAPVPSSASIEFNGVRFPVVSTVAGFIATVTTSDKVALRLEHNKQYATHMRDIIQQIGSIYPPSSPTYKALKSTCLVCTGCGWVFPGSYVLNLISPENFDRIVGAAPGFTEFGKSGICTKCGSTESFVVYQRFEPSGISQADVDAIRRYWRHLSGQWWHDTSSSAAICDHCSNYVSQAETYLIGGHLECERCTDEQLADGLNKLQGDPHYFGTMELQKARSFANL